MADPTVVIACERCRQPNRVPVKRIGQDAKCGSCKAPLPAPTEPIEATDADFLAILESSPLPVVVDFWAPWCGPCRMVGPILEDLAKAHSGQLLFVKINSDDNPVMSQRHGISSIPHLMGFSGGKKIAEQLGLPPRKALEGWVAGLVGK